MNKLELRSAITKMSKSEIELMVADTGQTPEDVYDATGKLSNIALEVVQWYERRSWLPMLETAYKARTALPIEAVLKGHFDYQELEEVSFELGIQSDTERTGTKLEYADGLIAFCRANGMVENLVSVIRSKRPDVDLSRITY